MGGGGGEVGVGWVGGRGLSKLLEMSGYRLHLKEHLTFGVPQIPAEFSLSFFWRGLPFKFNQQKEGAYPVCHGNPLGF